MTANPLAFDFPLMSPLSVRPPHAVPREEMLAEVEQELVDRRGFYQRMVDREKMSAAEAERHIALLDAVRADLAGDDGGMATWGWTDKVRELRRELAIRRAAWPKRIAKPGDPLDQATAVRRMERLDAVHFLYWIELFACDAWQAGPTLADTLDQVRAWTWRVEAWEMCAMLAGGPGAAVVRPRMVPYYLAIGRGEPAATAIWRTLEAAAVKHGFTKAEGIAA